MTIPQFSSRPPVIVLQSTEQCQIMSIPRREIIKFIGLLARDLNIKVTVKESFKGAICVGIGAFLGGLLGGPRGLAIGGALSGVWAGMSGADKYKSIIAAIKQDLSEEERNELVYSVWEIVREISPSSAVSAATLLSLVLRNATIERDIVDFLMQFFKDLGMPLKFFNDIF